MGEVGEVECHSTEVGEVPLSWLTGQSVPIPFCVTLRASFPMRLAFSKNSSGMSSPGNRASLSWFS